MDPCNSKRYDVLSTKNKKYLYCTHIIVMYTLQQQRCDSLLINEGKIEQESYIHGMYKICY